MKSKVQNGREYMKGLGDYCVEGIEQSLSQRIDIPIDINSMVDINPKEPYEFVARIGGTPLTKYRNQSLR